MYTIRCIKILLGFRCGRMTVDQTKGHFFRRILLLLFQYIEMKVDKQLTSSRSLYPNPLRLISSNKNIFIRLSNTIENKLIN